MTHEAEFVDRTFVLAEFRSGRNLNEMTKPATQLLNVGCELRVERPYLQLLMANLLSPKPVSYMQNGPYSGFQARGLSGFSDTPPPLTATSLAHPAPHQPMALLGTNSNLPQVGAHEEGKIYSLVIELMDANTRESALLELSKKREQYDDLALVLWHSFGVFLVLIYDTTT